MKYLLQGFVLGLAYVAPIGIQNLYVINTALRETRIRAYLVAAVTIFFDVSLGLTCFYGVGLLLENFPFLKKAILLMGAFIVIYIGLYLLRAVPRMEENIKVRKSFWQIVGICFAVTWLNPQAILDGSLLLGGFRASLPASASHSFITGVCLASVTWFIGLTTVVSLLRSSFNSKTLKIINVVCGLVVIFYGLKLFYSFLEALGLL